MDRWIFYRKIVNCSIMSIYYTVFSLEIFLTYRNHQKVVSNADQPGKLKTNVTVTGLVQKPKLFIVFNGSFCRAIMTNTWRKITRGFDSKKDTVLHTGSWSLVNWWHKSAYETLYKVLININEDGCWPSRWLGLDSDQCIKCDTPTLSIVGFKNLFLLLFQNVPVSV